MSTASLPVKGHCPTHGYTWHGSLSGDCAECIDELSFAQAELVALLDEDARELCEGHPAGPFDPMGETVYCDGRCAL